MLVKVTIEMNGGEPVVVERELLSGASCRV